MKPGKDPLTLPALQKRFSDPAACLAFLEKARWPDGPVCPGCGVINHASRITTLPGRFTCLDCGKRFSVTAGTPMHSTHLPIATWIIAMYLIASSSKGISSLKLASLLGLQYRTTWHLTHRIRAMMDSDPTLLKGIVEAVDAADKKPKLRRSIGQDELKEVLSYDPDTGIFVWKKALNDHIIVGSQAGYRNDGYINIGLHGSTFRAHRLAFIYMTGTCPEEVDHIDMDRSNNRWTNLRAALRSQNNANRRKQPGSKSSSKGVHWEAAVSAWCARIAVAPRKRIVLGYFPTEAEAHAAYVEAAKVHYGEFARLA